MKLPATTRTTAATSARPAPAAVATAEPEAYDAGSSVCPACGSPAYASVLTADTQNGGRLLVSCSRCGLLRFLTEAPHGETGGFPDFLFRQSPRGGFLHGVLEWLRRDAARSLIRFVLQGFAPDKLAGPALLSGGADGFLCRELQNRKVHCLAIASSLHDAQRCFHREGVDTVLCSPSEAPVKLGSLQWLLRAQGFSAESDPAHWLTHAARRLQPGGRMFLQVFDCSSWGFLVCGSNWVGLEPQSARFAYRAEDLEVLLELCGMRVVRRSHYFPLMNALVWASSLFPKLDASRTQSETPQSPLRVLLYMMAVLLVSPLAFLESLCHAGSVLMLEAERRA